MDFFQIKEREGTRKGVLDIYSDFKVVRSKDLMVRAKSFYAIWDDERQLWSVDEYDVQRLVDAELKAHTVQTPGNLEHNLKLLGNFSSNSWLQFRNYIGHLTDNSHQLDEKITFLNTEVTKEDYVSKRVDYAVAEGSIEAYSELFGTLYTQEEFDKLEWAIGAILTGDSAHIQKFLVLYGSGGTGKSTWINLLQWLTEGYYVPFNAKELTGNNNSFALEAFKLNPVVAIEHDGDLSKITDNSKLNSLVSHEPMEINEKNKPKWMLRPVAMLVIGTNTPVKFTDAKSGLARRLVDVRPTGETVAPRKYQALVAQMKFEIGAIADHCIKKYRTMGKDYYSSYRPVEMMLSTDVFFNYIEAHYDLFKEQDGATLKQAYALYLVFCEDTGIEFTIPQYKFRDELKNYFHKFEERWEMPDGTRVRSWYSGFNADKFKVQIKDDMAFSLVMDETESLLDQRYADLPAQYSNKDGNPRLYWNDRVRTKTDRSGNMVEFTPTADQIVSTKLSDLDTSKEHYVNVEDENEIVIDFDLTGDDGEKSLEKNLEAASQWPSTYAEISKSGFGVHLHYHYEGDASQLSRVYEPGIEIKVFTGDSSLRRKFTYGNSVPVATISSGLPIKEKKVMNTEGVKSEKGLRDLLERNLRKEILPGTKPTIDFMYKILEDMYKGDVPYDVSDMKNRILAFANNSTHQALYCLKVVSDMKFASEVAVEGEEAPKDTSSLASKVYFDTEVFPNLFVICWKAKGSNTVVRMINPTAQAVEELFGMLLVGFNCRGYDNHIMYAASMGYSNMDLYKLSKRLVGNEPNSKFGQAYNLSYADIYDFASAEHKKSLKKWQIELGLTHLELGLDWDEPVPEELWEKVVDYCANDVESTEAVDDHLVDDFIARQILASLSGLTVNDTTNKHSTRIIFGDERRPQSEFVYTKLADTFPGYEYSFGKSTYKGVLVGEGGLVDGEPGMYENVGELDVTSMHPTSIEQLNLFGKYTKLFSEIKQARILIKRGDFENARKAMGGRLAPFLVNEDNAKGLSDALKTVINSVYGLTVAKFDNSFKDPRNIDNIVAKRGALFMIDLKEAVLAQGYQVIHIKTDSIKIPNITPEIIEFVKEFGRKYGYDFELEGIYDKFALVNDAVYIAKSGDKWSAVGAQFQHPYVFKTLFSEEPIKFSDLCETKSVQTALYLDFDGEDTPMALSKSGKPHFVGKTGQFTPVKPGTGGAELVRSQETKDDKGNPLTKYPSATGAKGYRWLESSMVKDLHKEDDIDMSYFNKLVDSAKDNISQYGDFEWFVS